MENSLRQRTGFNPAAGITPCFRMNALCAPTTMNNPSPVAMPLNQAESSREGLKVASMMTLVKVGRCAEPPLSDFDKLK